MVCVFSVTQFIQKPFLRVLGKEISKSFYLPLYQRVVIQRLFSKGQDEWRSGATPRLPRVATMVVSYVAITVEAGNKFGLYFLPLGDVKRKRVM